MENYQLIGSFIATFLGGIAVYHYAGFWKNFFFKKQGAEIFCRDWFATWQTNSSSDSPWSMERIKISRQYKGLYFSNYDNSNNYQWEGVGQIFERSYLIGTWQSKRNTDSHGTFILSLSNQGEYLVGFFLGPNRCGFRNYGALVLAREREGEKGLEGGKRALREMGPTLQEVFCQH